MYLMSLHPQSTIPHSLFLTPHPSLLASHPHCSNLTFPPSLSPLIAHCVCLILNPHLSLLTPHSLSPTPPLSSPLTIHCLPSILTPHSSHPIPCTLPHLCRKLVRMKGLVFFKPLPSFLILSKENMYIIYAYTYVPLHMQWSKVLSILGAECQLFCN